MPRPSLVTRLEPTLITSRRAPAATEAPAVAAASSSLHSLRRRRELRRMRSSHVLDRVDETRGSPRRRSRQSRTPGPSSDTTSTNARDALLALVRRDQVELVQHEPARLVEERLVVALELPDDRARIGDRIGCRHRAARCRRCAAAAACAADGAGNWWPSPAPSAAPSIRPGNVGDDEAAVLVDAHDAQVGRQRRERVVGDFGPRGGDRADQRRLAGVRHAEQPDVGEHLELEMQHALHAFFARRRLARRAIGARFEMQVAEAALAALRQQRLLAVRGEVGDEFARVGDR